MDPTTPSSTDNVRALHSRYWERTGLPLDIIRPCIQYLEEHNSNSNSNNSNKGGNRRTRVPRLPRLKHGRLAKLLTTGAQYHNNSSYNRRYNSPLDLLNHIRREKRALDRISSGVVVIASSSADVSLASKLLDREQNENENENENATLDTFSLVGEIRRVLVLADDIVRSSIEFPREQRLARRRPMLRFDDDDYDDDYDDDDYDDCDYNDCGYNDDYNDCDYHDYHDQDDSHQLDTIDKEFCLPQPSSSGFWDGAFEMDEVYGCRIRTDLDVDVDVDVDVHVDIEDEDEDEENPTNASECHNEHEFEHYPPSGMDSSWSLPSMTTFDWVSDANTIFDTEGEGGGEYDIIPESAEARDGIITDNYNDDDNNDNNNNNNENDDDNESAWSVLTGCETVHSMGNLGDGRMVSYSAAVRLGISGARKQTRESTTETRSAPPVAVTDAAIAAPVPVPVPVHEDDPNGRDGSARNDVDDDDDRDRAFDDVSIYEGAKSGRGGRASRLFKGNIRHQKSSSTCRVRNQRRANSSRSPAPRKQDKKTRTHAIRNNTDC